MPNKERTVFIHLGSLDFPSVSAESYAKAFMKPCLRFLSPTNSQDIFQILTNQFWKITECFLIYRFPSSAPVQSCLTNNVLNTFREPYLVTTIRPWP